MRGHVDVAKAGRAGFPRNDGTSIVTRSARRRAWKNSTRPSHSEPISRVYAHTADRLAPGMHNCYGAVDVNLRLQRATLFRPPVQVCCEMIAVTIRTIAVGCTIIPPTRAPFARTQERTGTVEMGRANGSVADQFIVIDTRSRACRIEEHVAVRGANKASRRPVGLGSNLEFTRSRKVRFCRVSKGFFCGVFTLSHSRTPTSRWAYCGLRPIFVRPKPPL